MCKRGLGALGLASVLACVASEEGAGRRFEGEVGEGSAILTSSPRDFILTDGVYQVRQLGWTAHMDPDGLTLVGEQEARLRLAQLTCGGASTPVDRTPPMVKGNRATYASAVVDEWYVSTELGLEQGFTVRETAQCAKAEDVVLTMSVEGLSASHEGPTITLGADDGTPRYNISELHAFDATGRELEASMSGDGDELSYRVDVSGAVYPITVDPLIGVAAFELPNPDENQDEGEFGWSVALEGDTAIVGAKRLYPEQGTAFAFVRSGVTWTLQGELLPSPVINAGIGASVALSGDTAIVGAPEQGFPSAPGSATVFVRVGALWTQQASVRAIDGTNQDGFGSASAIVGDIAIIGAPKADPAGVSSAGAAYVFSRTGTVWAQTAKLIAPTNVANAKFGSAVAVRGNQIVVGAPGTSAAYAFSLSGGSWTLEGQLTELDSPGTGAFGTSVALAGTEAIVGAPTKGGFGAAYVFQHVGNTWTQNAKLVDETPTGTDNFGWSVALLGDRALVGAPTTSAFTTAGSGAVFIFQRSGQTWTQDWLAFPPSSRTKLYNSKGRVGQAVALTDTSFIVGSNTSFWGNAIVVDPGEAHVFDFAQHAFTCPSCDDANPCTTDTCEGPNGCAFTDLDGSQCPGGTCIAGDCSAEIDPPLTADLEAPLLADAPSVDLRFGTAVDLSADTAVVTSRPPLAGGNQSQQAAHVFVRNGSSWDPQARIGQANISAGFNVALQHDTLMLGAWDSGISSPYLGNTYAYARTASIWSTQGELEPLVDRAAAVSNGLPKYGIVDLDNDTAVVGAPSAASGEHALVFVRYGQSWLPRMRVTSGTSNTQFGLNVSLSGSSFIVHAPKASRAHVFTGSDDFWTQEGLLTAGISSTNILTGTRTVAIWGDTAIVGSDWDPVGGISQAGQVYVFHRAAGVWTQQAVLSAGDPQTNGYFGRFVSLEGDRAAIGAPGADSAAGAGYVFTRSGTTWTQQLKVIASDAAAGDMAGPVELQGNRLIIGAPQASPGGTARTGKAYLYRLQTSVGTTCTGDEGCETGFCVDDFCCDTACGGDVEDDCQACSVAAGALVNGTCSDLPDQTVCATGECMSGVCELIEGTGGGGVGGGGGGAGGEGGGAGGAGGAGAAGGAGGSGGAEGGAGDGGSTVSTGGSPSTGGGGQGEGAATSSAGGHTASVGGSSTGGGSPSDGSDDSSDSGGEGGCSCRLATPNSGAEPLPGAFLAILLGLMRRRPRRQR